MNKKYKINWMENKEGRSGKKYVVMHLLDEAGKETQNVSTFELTYTLAQEIEGEIVQNGNYLNWKPKLEAPAFIKNNSAYKAQQIEKTMARKEESIGKFQDTKEWSIKVASTINKAVDLAVADYTAYQGTVLSDRILYWRKFLWNNWDVNLDATDAITGKLN